MKTIIGILTMISTITTGCSYCSFPGRVKGEPGISSANDAAIVELYLMNQVVAHHRDYVVFVEVDGEDLDVDALVELDDHAVLVRPFSESQRWTTVFADSAQAWHSRAKVQNDGRDLREIYLRIEWVSDKEALIHDKSGFQERARLKSGEWMMDRPNPETTAYN